MKVCVWSQKMILFSSEKTVHKNSRKTWPSLKLVRMIRNQHHHVDDHLIANYRMWREDSRLLKVRVASRRELNKAIRLLGNNNCSICTFYLKAIWTWLEWEQSNQFEGVETASGLAHGLWNNPRSPSAARTTALQSSLMLAVRFNHTKVLSS